MLSVGAKLRLPRPASVAFAQPLVSRRPAARRPALSFSVRTRSPSMLRPANVVDLPILRALIREGALTGSFDRSLATESRESALFFTNLRQALASGYFVETDPRTGDLSTVAVLAFVYLSDEDPTMHRPI